MNPKYFKLIFFTALLCCLFSAAKGQEHFSIKGHVTEDEQNISYVIIALLNSQDSTYVQSTTTDSLGLFHLEQVQSGSYIIASSLMGYSSQSKLITVDKNLEINFNISSSDMELEEIVVKGNRPLVEYDIDRMVFNVSNSPIISSSNMWEALSKTPTVRTTMQNQLLVNNITAQIYINDRPIRLSGNDAFNYLQSLSAESIQKIEVITNPSAKYEANGGAIINIVLKKDPKLGMNSRLNGSVSLGRALSYRSGANFNYRNKKTFFSANYGLARLKNINDLYSYINYFDTLNTISSSTNFDEIQTVKGISHNYNLSFEHQIDNKNTIGFGINGFTSNSKSLSEVISLENNLDNIELSRTETNTDYTDEPSQNNINVYYQSKLDSANGKIDIDLNYINYLSNPNSNSLNQKSIPGSDDRDINFKNGNEQSINIYSGKLNYSFTTKKGTSFNTGFKLYTLETKNIQNSENIINADFLPASPNIFNYNEGTTSAYVSATKGINRIGFNVGLRAEYTHLVGTGNNNTNLFDNNYLQLFPTVYIAYALNPEKGDRINFSYGRKINRPDYWRLNPFESYITPFYSTTGNPFLIPAIPNLLQLTFMLRRKYHINLYYYNTKNRFTGLPIQDNESQLYRYYQVNLDRNITYGINGFSSFFPTEKLGIHAYLQLSNSVEKGQNEDLIFELQNVNFYASITNEASLYKDRLKAEISLWYESPNIEGLSRFKSRHDLSFGLKYMINNNGSVTMRFSDVFRKNGYESYVDYETQNNGFIEIRDTRKLTLQLAYNLGNLRLGNPEQRKVADEDENNRIQAHLK